MVKVIGKKIVKKENVSLLYYVKRKSRKNCTRETLLLEFGRSSIDNCKRTCDLLNNSAENFTVNLKAKSCKAEKLYFYYPKLSIKEGINNVSKMH
jgi:hypothetical protein